jgi:hypothetical protein
MEQARQKYETTLPQLLAVLQQQHASEFADIKTPADIERVANDDRARYVKWDLQRITALVRRRLRLGPSSGGRRHPGPP